MSEFLYYDLKKVSGLAPSLSGQVAREIGRRIVAGSYAEKELIEDEAALADRYQVSRSVIRDAVKVLVGKGLLEVRRGIGTRVHARDKWGLLDNDVLAWHQSAPLNADMLRELMEIRQVFEPRAARWAAERGSDEAISHIERAMEQMEARATSNDEYVAADAAFHRAIVRAAGNEFLMALEGVIFSALLSSIRLTNTDPQQNEDSIPFHRDVCSAIVKRNGTKAQRLMERLLSDADERLEHRLREHKKFMKRAPA